MKYFWHIFSIILGLTAIIFLFFVFSVKVKDSITYTDQAAPLVPEITIADPSVGPANAKVTIVNYGDYECKACAELEKNLATLREDYGTALRIVWKDMPNASAHKEAIPAAVAARCAEKQGKFWEYHAYLLANQDMLGSEFYQSVATSLSLKMNSFNRCVTNEDTLPLVERGYDEGLALHITATPTLFINNERYTGNLSLAELKRTIDGLLSSM